MEYSRQTDIVKNFEMKNNTFCKFHCNNVGRRNFPYCLTKHGR